MANIGTKKYVREYGWCGVGIETPCEHRGCNERAVVGWLAGAKFGKCYCQEHAPEEARKALEAERGELRL